jgi:hypothetical protein
MLVSNRLVSLIAIVTLAGCTDFVTVTDSGTLPFIDDTSTTRNEFCQESFSTDPAPGPACVEDTIRCGETVTATNEGGQSNYDLGFYQPTFCFVDSNDFDGQERVWIFDQPAYSSATVTVDHCNQASVVAMSWSDEESCPEVGSTVNRCEGSSQDGDVTFFVDRETRWLIAVDTRSGEEGNFTLNVTCE